MTHELKRDGVWRKSARSGVQSNCVEVRFDGVGVWVRNSNDPDPGGPVIGVSAERWLGVLDGVRAGDLALERLAVPVRVDGGLVVRFDGDRVVVEAGVAVRYTTAEWEAFLGGVREDGEFGLGWLLGEPSAA
ncbi:DUF397 domain-containing protein [Sphaerisporangium sp. TRM90804]|uniref:DUF397 domain-containing protein n=1 Tax=Sphaerisporangium sp. TRM90804 TaxID=3031113 RepID=UPI0024474170|nr:DUF397 domain-containing protein [Sphaerisporangium sp. TRM90804]MDH2428657.1 DUF397 domain-containing protein [Sphaerisporangium sp. TRM90804]